MAQQKGIFKVKGTLGDVSFYKTKDGYLVREKTSLDGSRIASDPAFVRTRENSAEFSRAAQAGKLVRHAFRQLAKQASDDRVVSRMTKVMMTSLRLDSVHARGERTVVEHLDLLKGFDFNINGRLSTTLYVPFISTIDRSSGQLSIHLDAYRPTAMIVAPEGTTHYAITAAGAIVDFDQSTFEVQSAGTGLLPLDTTAVEASELNVTVTADSTAPILLALGITFSQEVNGEQYPLKNGAYNALNIVESDI